MTDVATWQDLMQQAMALESSDLVAAWTTYGQATEAGMAEVQAWFDSVEGVGATIEAFYGALIAASQQAMCRVEIEGHPEPSSEHAFRLGHAYGISSVLNHLVDRLRDRSGATNLEQLDALSDMVHDEIVASIGDADIKVEVLDAKGEVRGE